MVSDDHLEGRVTTRGLLDEWKHTPYVLLREEKWFLSREEIVLVKSEMTVTNTS